MLMDTFKTNVMNHSGRQSTPAATQKAELPSFLSGVRDKRMQNEYNTFVQGPHRYDQAWVEKTMQGHK